VKIPYLSTILSVIAYRVIAEAHKAKDKRSLKYHRWIICQIHQITQV